MISLFFYIKIVVSNEKVLKILEKRKDLFSAEDVEAIKNNIDNISDEAKQKIIDADQHADEVISILDKFETEVAKIKEDDEKAIKEIKKKTRDYQEEKERKKENKDAEQILKTL